METADFADLTYMSAFRLPLVVLAACLLASGCAAPAGSDPFSPLPRPVSPQASHPPKGSQDTAVRPAAFREVADATPIEALATLNAEDVVRVVLERNPTLDQMRATAAAVAARYPQVTSLDDPSFAFSTAPGSIGSPNVDYAARVEISQKFLYPGKRGLKGATVNAESAAANEDIEDTRLQLAEAARSALADYFLAVKATTVAEENAKLLREFRQNAETRYKTGQGQQQDVLQADVEIARQEERFVSLRRAKQVALARLNTLMHRSPDSVLPPPAEMSVALPLPEVAKLREVAATRPDVRAVAARVAAEEATLALAMQEYKPDIDVMAAYDGFWQGAGGRPLQWQIGARVNLPVRSARRNGAVEEARAKVAQKRAELARLTDQVNYQVQEAFEQVREAAEIVKLYEDRVLKVAEANVKEAQTAYANSKIPFLNLVEAQRNRVMLRDRYFEAIAELARRRATLERAVGGPIQEK